MRRAPCFLIALAAAFLLGVPPAAPQGGHLPVDGIYMVDYSKPPNFQVGTWVKYRAIARGVSGYYQEFTLTLVVAGEEEFWGERGFWLETHTEDPGELGTTVASFISYDAFGDTAAVRQPLWFQRKAVNRMDEKGKPFEELALRPSNELRKRDKDKRASELPDPDRPAPVYDTLGVDTTQVPLGTYRGLLCRQIQSWFQTRTTADSTIYVYRHESRVSRKGDSVPITRLVREDLDDITAARHWKTGLSKDAKERLHERVTGTTMLVAFGTDNPPALRSTPERARGKRLPPERPRLRGARATGSGGGGSQR